MKSAHKNQKQVLLGACLGLISSVCNSQQTLNQLIKLNGVQELVDMAKDYPLLAIPFIRFTRASFKFQSMIAPFKKQGIVIENMAIICDFVDLDEETSASTSLIVKHIASTKQCEELADQLEEGEQMELKKLNVLVLNEEYVDIFHKAESIEILLQKTAEIIENEQIEKKVDELRLCLKGLTLFGKAGYVKTIEELGGISVVGNSLETKNISSIHYGVISLADQLTSLNGLNEEDEEDYCMIFTKAQEFLKKYQQHIGIIKHCLIISETLAANENVLEIAVEMKTDQMVMELLKKFSGVPEIVELSFKLLAAILTDEDQVIKFANEESLKALISIGQENIRFVHVCYPLVAIFDTIVTVPECQSLMKKDSLLVGLARIILGKSDSEKEEFEQGIMIDPIFTGKERENQNRVALVAEMRSLGKDIFLQLFEVKELKEANCLRLLEESKKNSGDSEEIIKNQLILRVVVFSVEISSLFSENKLPENLHKELYPKCSKDAFLKNQWEIIDESLLLTSDFYSFARDKKKLQGLVGSHIFLMEFLRMFERVLSTNRYLFNLWKLVKLLSSTLKVLEPSCISSFASTQPQILDLILEGLMKSLVKFQDNPNIFCPLVLLLSQFALISLVFIDKLMKLKLSKVVCAKLSEEDSIVPELLLSLSLLKVICEKSEASCKILNADKCIDILLELKSKHKETKVIKAVAEVIKLLMRDESQEKTVQKYLADCIKQLKEKLEKDPRMTEDKVELLTNIQGFLNLSWVSPLIASSGLLKLLVSAIKQPEPSELALQEYDFTKHTLEILLSTDNLKDQIDAKSFIQWGLKFLQAGPSELFQKVLKLIRRLLEENTDLAHEFNNEKVAELFVSLQKDQRLANDVDQMIGIISTVCPQFIKHFDYDRSIRQIISKTTNHIDKKEKESLLKCLNLLEGISKVSSTGELMMKHGILMVIQRILEQETEQKLEKAGKTKKEDLKLYEISLSSQTQQWFQEVSFVFSILKNLMGNIPSSKSFKAPKLKAIMNLVSWVGLTNQAFASVALEIFSKMSENTSAFEEYNEENLIDLVMSVLNAHPYSTEHLSKGAVILEGQEGVEMIKEVSESVKESLSELDPSDEESLAGLRQGVTYLSNLVLCDHAKKNLSVYRSLCKSVEGVLDVIEELDDEERIHVEVPILFLFKRIAMVSEEAKELMGKKIVSYVAKKALNLVDMKKYPLVVVLTAETVLELLSLDERTVNCLSGETGEVILMEEEAVASLKSATENHIEGLLDMGDNGTLPKSRVLQLVELFSRKNDKIVEVITTGKNFSRIIQLVKEVKTSDNKAYLKGVRALSRLLQCSDTIDEIDDGNAAIIQDILSHSNLGELAIPISRDKLLAHSEFLKSEMVFVKSALIYFDTNPELVKEIIIKNIFFIFTSLKTGPYNGEEGLLLFTALDVLSSALFISPTIGILMNERLFDEFQELLKLLEKALGQKLIPISKAAPYQEDDIIGSAELDWQILEAAVCCIEALASHPRCNKFICSLNEAPEGEKLEETLIKLSLQSAANPFVVTKALSAISLCLENNTGVVIGADNPQMKIYDSLFALGAHCSRYQFCDELCKKIKGLLDEIIKKGLEKSKNPLMDGVINQIVGMVEANSAKKGFNEEVKKFVRKKTKEFEMGDFLKQIDQLASVFEDLVRKLEKNEMNSTEFQRLMLIIQGIGIFAEKEPEKCSRLVRIGAHFSLLRLLDREETPKPIRNEALIALKKLLDAPEIYEKLKGTTGIIVVLIKNIRIAEDEEAVANAAYSLELMAENEQNIGEIEKVGGSQILLAAFQKSKSTETQGQLLLVISNLMTSNETTKEMKGKGIIASILEISKRDFDDLAMYRALAYMIGRLANDEETQNQLGSPSIVGTLKKGCDKYPKDEKLLINCSFGLANLCYNHPKNGSIVLENGLVAHLVQNLRNGVITDKVVEQGAILVSNISYKNKQMKKTLGQLGICLILVQLLRRFNETELQSGSKKESSLNHMLKAVANISSLDENATLLFKEKYLVEATRTITSFKESKSVLKFAIAGFGNIFNRLSDKEHMEIIKSPLLSEMNTLISENSNAPGILTIAAESLCFLAQTSQASNTIMNKTSLIESFLKSLYDHDHNAPLVQEVTRFLDHLTESEEVAKKMVEMSTLEVFTSICRIHKTNKGILPHLLRIIIRLTPDKKNAKQLHELGFSNEAFRIYDPELLKDDIKNFFILLMKISMFEDSSEVLAQTGSAQLVQAADKNINNDKTLEVLLELFVTFSELRRCHAYLLSSGIIRTVKKVITSCTAFPNLQHAAVDILMNIAEETPESREIMKQEKIEDAFGVLFKNGPKEASDKVTKIKNLVLGINSGTIAFEEAQRREKDTNPKKGMLGEAPVKGAVVNQATSGAVVPSPVKGGIPTQPVKGAATQQLKGAAAPPAEEARNAQNNQQKGPNQAQAAQKAPQASTTPQIQNERVPTHQGHPQVPSGSYYGNNPSYPYQGSGSGYPPNPGYSPAIGYPPTYPAGYSAPYPTGYPSSYPTGYPPTGYSTGYQQPGYHSGYQSGYPMQPTQPQPYASGQYNSGIITVTMTSTSDNQGNSIQQALNASTVVGRIFQSVPDYNIQVMKTGSNIVLYKENGSTKEKYAFANMEQFHVTFPSKRDQKSKVKSKYVLPIRSIQSVKIGYDVHSPFIKKSGVFGKRPDLANCLTITCPHANKKAYYIRFPDPQVTKIWQESLTVISKLLSSY